MWSNTELPHPSTCGRVPIRALLHERRHEFVLPAADEDEGADAMSATEGVGGGARKVATAIGGDLAQVFAPMVVETFKLHDVVGAGLCF
jgi:hypothetical protein